MSIAPSTALVALDRRVREALDHLYDVPYLQLCDLGGLRGSTLQEALLSAIDRLRPMTVTPRAGGRTREIDGGARGRVHRLLVLRYVDGLTGPALWRQLGISERQFQRDHARGVAAVASLIDERLRPVEAFARRDPSRSTPSEAHAQRRLANPLTSFVGREREMDELSRLIGTSPLVTLTGPGGCGKTRLALELSMVLTCDYPDRLWSVDLASVGDETSAPVALLAALGLAERGRLPAEAVLRDHFSGEPSLLLLDNCEQVAAGLGRLVKELLGSCPRLRVLATSRVPLGVPGELVWTVAPLGTPGAPTSFDSVAASPAVRLFVDRARLVRPRFDLASSNLDAVVRICQRLEGLPLALELAAAWLRVMPVQQIAERLEARLWELTSGGTVAPRHETLRRTIDGSYDLLSDGERTLFRCLSVFAGGFDLDAIEAVRDDDTCSRALDLLAGLVDKSLVVVWETGKRGRYRLLEPVRRYASEALVQSGEDVAARNRHLTYFADLAARGAAGLFGREQVSWAACFALEQDNLRAALSWARQRGEGEAGLKLAASVAPFWIWCGLGSEVRAWLTWALDVSDAAPSGYRVRALNWLGRVENEAGEAQSACALGERAVAAARSCGDGLALALRNLALSIGTAGDWPASRPLFEEALAIARRTGDRREEAAAMVHMARALREMGEPEHVKPLVDAGLKLAREVGDAVVLSVGLLGRSLLERQDGAPHRARTSLTEASACARAAGYGLGVAHAELHLADLAHEQGDRLEAAARYREALTAAWRCGHVGAIGTSLRGIANIAAEEGRLEHAAQILATARTVLVGDACGPDDDGRGIELEQRTRALGIAPEPLTLGQAVALALGRAG